MRIAWISSDFKNSPQSHSDVGGGIQPPKKYSMYRLQLGAAFYRALTLLKVLKPLLLNADHFEYKFLKFIYELVWNLTATVFYQ